MNSEQLELELRAALARLQHADYRPSAQFAALLGCTPDDAALKVKSAIYHAIASLQPPPDAASTSPARRVYDLLYHRFVLGLTLQETADRLHLSFSTTCRTQRTAVHALARVLWEQHQASSKAGRGEEAPLPGPTSENGPADWHAQAQRELASLTMHTPGGVSDVGQVIRGVRDLLAPVLQAQNVSLEVAFSQADLATTVHPAVLRQLLITAIRRIARYAAGGQVLIYASLHDGAPRITLTAPSPGANLPSEMDLTADLLLVDDVVAEASITAQQLTLTLDLPSVGAITVLLVDDNPDLARLFHRAAEGTPYHIVHVAQGRGLFDTIRAVAPDIIVLDVMLPDIDGWDLLMQLHANPATQRIPVLICTVVKEEELALSLGAAGYLAKPVRPREFIQALQRLAPAA